MTRESPAAHDGRVDLERAIASLGERLPQPLLPLARLAYNYRWSWLAGGPAVFRDIHPLVWRRSECNPLDVIQAASPRRLRALAADTQYLARLAGVAAEFERDLARPAADTPISPACPVAYFSSEFAVHCSLPLYGGGLGVLAGDVLKAASDLALPLVGVGLLYRQGYMHQRLDASGWQHEYWTNTTFERLPLVRVTGPDGRRVTVTLSMRGREVGIKVWRVDVGRVPLYLLDTDREANHPIDRWITARLYVGDRQTRLAQYAVLGIGGMRALDALGIRPSVVHLNEGHAVLGVLERARPFLAAGETLDDALARVRAATAFTTHTPVAAGNETYDAGEIEQVLGAYLDAIGVPRARFFDLGRVRPGDPSGGVGATVLALRTSRAANGVSRRHGEVARGMWRTLWPERSVARVPIGHVTNGVHTETWMAEPMQALLDRHLGPEWRSAGGADPALWERIAAIPDRELWDVRGTLRRALVDLVRERSVRDRLSRGEPPSYVEAAARCFGSDVMTVGFARRMATYKRFHLLTRDPTRGLALLGNETTPMQIVVAGKAHPQDQEAKEALRDLFRIKAAPVVGERVAFVEDYDLHVAPRIVAGVDLWLNLPRPPLEASGTSGMKVVLNGGLNLSVLDGWWVEAFDGANGWAIASSDGDPHVQDARDAEALFDLMETEIVPLFYDRDADGIPRAWVERMKNAMRGLIPRFSAARMLRDYAHDLYAPAPGSPPPA